MMSSEEERKEEEQKYKTNQRRVFYLYTVTNYYIKNYRYLSTTSPEIYPETIY